MPANINSVCILRLSAIGDVCNAVAVVQSIQRQHPQAQLTWVIGKVEASLLASMPGIDFIIFDKSQGIAAYKMLYQALNGKVFDYLLHMQVSLRANLASLCIKARHKTGFDWHTAKELHSVFINNTIVPAPRCHVLEGFQQFAKVLGVTDTALRWQMPLSAADTDWARQQLTTNKRHLVICAGASKTERNWPAERYAAVADYAVQQGFSVYLCGSPHISERQLAADIEYHSRSQLHNLVGKSSLKQLLALLQQASLALTPDSGPAHMAVTVSTPVIGLYAHSNPARTGPYLYQHYVVSVYQQAIKSRYGKDLTEIAWGTRAKGAHLMQHISVAAVIRMFDKVVLEQQL